MGTWVPHDIIIEGDMITVPGMSPEEGHRWFSETILDGKLPLWAPIGMLFSPITGNIKPEITLRNNTFIETPLSMMASMRGVVFTGLYARRAKCIWSGPEQSGVEGVLRWDETPLHPVGEPNNSVKVLATNPYFATATKRVNIIFYAVMSTGYHTMAQNSEEILLCEEDNGRRANAKPLVSDHTLNNFLRVWAVPVNGKIRVSYMNGLTPELLKQIWEEAKRYAES